MSQTIRRNRLASSPKGARLPVIFALTSLTGCISNTAPSPVSTNTNLEVHAHRGGAALRPENSLDAFTTAVTQVGVDSIELDIHQTSDNALIVNHNNTINPLACLNPDGTTITNPPTISSMTLAQVQQYDCGTLVGLPRGTPLPTLNQVFETVEALTPLNGKKIEYDLHIKWAQTTIGASQYATLILDVIQNYGTHDRVHFMNDIWSLLQATRALDSTIQLYYLTGQLQPSDLASAEAVQLTAVVPDGQSLTQSTVSTYHAQGILVIPYTINIPYEWSSLMNIGVDGIITDNPAGLNQLLSGDLTNQVVLGPGGD
jgi:glycerophosphoryl diester phosphodiesterase